MKKLNGTFKWIAMTAVATLIGVLSWNGTRFTEQVDANESRMNGHLETADPHPIISKELEAISAALAELKAILLNKG